MVQNIISKGFKYSFFMPTKEIAFVPLDEELKAKGKGICDVIGERFGKSGGALVQWLMLSLLTNSTLITIAPNIFIVYLVVLAAWMIAVIALNRALKVKML